MPIETDYYPIQGFKLGSFPLGFRVNPNLDFPLTSSGIEAYRALIASAHDSTDFNGAGIFALILNPGDLRIAQVRLFNPGLWNFDPVSTRLLKLGSDRLRIVPADFEVFYPSGAKGLVEVPFVDESRFRRVIDGYPVTVGPGGVLLRDFQIKMGLANKLYFPSNYPPDIDPGSTLGRKITQEVRNFTDGMRRGMLPVNVLRWRDVPKFPSDVLVHRVNGYRMGTKLAMVRLTSEATEMYPDTMTVVIDPKKREFVPTSSQYYEQEELYPRR